jgi:hypothetical protein
MVIQFNRFNVGNEKPGMTKIAISSGKIYFDEIFEINIKVSFGSFLAEDYN